MITPGPGYILDPTNPNAVIRDPGNMQASTALAQNTGVNLGAVAPPPTSPVGMISSAQGQTIANQNTQNLQNTEMTYTGQQPFYIESGTGQQVSKDVASANTDPNKFYVESGTGNIIRNVTGSPATQTMVDDINKAVSGGNLTSEQMGGLKTIQATQDAITAAAANARIALESGDYGGMDKYMTFIKDQQKAYQDSLTKYYADIAPLRQKAMDLLSPGAREQELATQLNTIRGQADAFDLQTQQDKLAEYQGQTLGFAGGRAAELDFKASFKRQEYALKEKNLLASLGLEQDSRKMQQEGVDKQMGYLADDLDLQTKVNDKIATLEESVFDKADKLRAESKQTLGAILDGLAGVDVASLNPDSRKNLEQMAAQAGLPFDLVLQALDAQYKRQVFEDTLKTAKDEPKVADDSVLSVGDARALGVPYGTTQSQAAAMGKVPQYEGASSGAGTGTGSGTSSGLSSSAVTQLKTALNESKYQGPEADGKYADPNLYLTNYKDYLQNGGSAEEFFKAFPPATYINPANTWMPEEIMRFVKKLASSSSTSLEDRINALTQ